MNLNHSSQQRDNEFLMAENPLESVTLQSEISMSIVTEATNTRARPRRFFDRVIGRRNRHDTGVTDFTELNEEEDGKGRFINVEPTMMLVSLSMGIHMNASSLFTYWARCVEMAKDFHGEGVNATEVCAQLGDSNSTTFNDAVERDIVTTRIFIQLASTIPTLIIAPLIGNWSDHHGRRKPLLFSLGGMIIYHTLWVAATLLYKSFNVYDFLFTAEVVGGLAGGMGAVHTAMLSIITDDSRTSLQPGRTNVPMRIAISSAIQAMGNVLGSLVMSFLSIPAIKSVSQHEAGYVQAEIAAAILIIGGFLYAAVFVRETHRLTKDTFRHEDSVDGDERYYLVDEDVQSRPSAIYTGSAVRRKARQLCEVLTDTRPGYARLCLNLSLVFVFVEFLALDANLLLLLLKRQPFNWDDRKFTLLNLQRAVCMMLGMLAFPLFLRKVNVLGKDSVMIGVGVFFGAVSFFVLSFAKTSEEIVFASFLSFFSGAVGPGYRTFLPRMVPKEQTARLLTVCSIIMALCPIISSLIFNNIFQWSLTFWPGLAFFIGGIFQSIVTLGQIMIHCLMRPQWKIDEQQRDQRLVDEDDEEEVIMNGHDRDERWKGAEERERSVSNEAVGSDSPNTSGSEGEARPVLV